MMIDFLKCSFDPRWALTHGFKPPSTLACLPALQESPSGEPECCSICLEPMAAGECALKPGGCTAFRRHPNSNMLIHPTRGRLLRELRCGHVFHQTEIDKWLSRCSNLCRHFQCLSLTFHCLSLAFHCLSVTFHCLSVTRCSNTCPMCRGEVFGAEAVEGQLDAV